MEVIKFRSCGWCITLLCSECLPEFEYFNRLFVCDCVRCKKDYVPVHLRGKETETEETND